MGHGNVQFHCGQGSGQCGIGVAIHQDPVRLFLEKHLLDLFDHPPGVLPMTAPADTQVVIRRGYLQFVEEYLAHVGVEVLAGVDEHFSNGRGAMGDGREGAGDGGGLDELGACAEDGCDFHRG